MIIFRPTSIYMNTVCESVCRPTIATSIARSRGRGVPIDPAHNKARSCAWDHSYVHHNGRSRWIAEQPNHVHLNKEQLGPGRGDCGWALQNSAPI